MKTAISTEGHLVSEHFGRCPTFTIVNIENGRLLSTEVIENPGHHPGFIPRFLHERGVRSIVAGGMGQRASALFLELGMHAVVGVRGAVVDVVNELLTGTLESGESLCKPGAGKGYGQEKTVCDHAHDGHHHHKPQGEQK